MPARNRLYNINIASLTPILLRFLRKSVPDINQNRTKKVCSIFLFCVCCDLHSGHAIEPNLCSILWAINWPPKRKTVRMTIR